MIHQSIINIAEICSKKGVTRAVISPGSRSAPLTLVFSRHPSITTYVINDERSAAFIALGMAQVSAEPVVLICTSGSAAYNYAPAVAEAFFNEIPLIVLTADRPPEWIDQKDGQTIRQQNIYGSNCKSFFQLPVNPGHTDEEWHIERMISEGINLACSEKPQGPVHFNIPFREPFYPEVDNFEYKSPKTIDITLPDNKQEDWNSEELSEIWSKYSRKILVLGQGQITQELEEALTEFVLKHDIPVVSDIISNGHRIPNTIKHQDLFLMNAQKELQLEVVISFGKSVISKNLKLFLRRFKPIEHWHIQPHTRVSDTFQSLTRIILTEPVNFFRGSSKFEAVPDPLSGTWKDADHEAHKHINEFFNRSSFNEMECLHTLLGQLPSGSNLHLANSMSVRYANFLGLDHDNRSTVYANRGTSGIDGSTSTAVGSAIASSETLNFLITGDMAFFYDRNAFWNQYVPPNLRIILLNNHSGVIFGNIPGPASLPSQELEELFEGYQPLNAQRTADEFGLKYYNCKSYQDLDQVIPEFYQNSDQAIILEIETDKNTDKNVFKDFKERYK